MGRLPGIINHQQAGFIAQQSAQVSAGCFDGQGMELVIPQRLDPAAEQREHIRLLAEAGPQYAIFEMGLHLGIISQGSRQHGLANPAQSMHSADGQNPGRIARLC